uniref:m7GpppN-mRNA hydrolase NUDT17 n=1 Tax=Cyprinus carpio TaxID=7962 RepID=A0A8C2F6C5_CYPCA
MEKVRKILVHQSKVQVSRAQIYLRASFCPIKYLSHSEADSLPPDTLNRGVDVGVAVLLQSANQRLLLTRRASSLRIFSMFGFHRGHVELDEKLLDAGLRELKEETGLKLSPDEISSQLLGLWESVYPHLLSSGIPKRHHIVTYIILRSSQSHFQLLTCLRTDPAEVSACVWVYTVRRIVQIPADLVTEVSPHGELIETLLEDIERISTETKFALELWLITLEPHSEMG